MVRITMLHEYDLLRRQPATGEALPCAEMRKRIRQH
jgi:hypothetical protein